MPNAAIGNVIGVISIFIYVYRKQPRRFDSPAHPEYKV